MITSQSTPLLHVACSACERRFTATLVDSMATINQEPVTGYAGARHRLQLLGWEFYSDGTQRCPEHSVFAVPMFDTIPVEERV